MKPQDRTRLILQSNLSPSYRLILVVLADFMSDDRLRCWPKVETVARRSGYGERQVRVLLAEIQAAGLIRRESGEHKTDDIIILWDAVASAPPPLETRGGRREKRGAKSAGHPANFAGQGAEFAGQGADFAGDPANFAARGANSAPEATIEATRKRPLEATRRSDQEVTTAEPVAEAAPSDQHPRFAEDDGIEPPDDLDLAFDPNQPELPPTIEIRTQEDPRSSEMIQASIPAPPIPEPPPCPSPATSPVAPPSPSPTDSPALVAPVASSPTTEPRSPLSTGGPGSSPIPSDLPPSPTAPGADPWTPGSPVASVATSGSPTSTAVPITGASADPRPVTTSASVAAGYSPSSSGLFSPTTAESAPETATMPWARRQGVPAADIEAMVLSALEGIRGAPVNPSRCATDAKEILGLWKAIGRPPCSDMARDLRLVAEWARLSDDKAAARDIRAEGWADGQDRSRSVATLCRRDRWGDRLAAAETWNTARNTTALAQPGRVVLEEQADGTFTESVQPRPKLNLWAVAKELGL